MEDNLVIQFHEDLEECVRNVINDMNATWPHACKLGNTDMSSIILRYLWQIQLNKRPIDLNIESYKTSLDNIKFSLASLVTRVLANNEDFPAKCCSWQPYLQGQEGKILVFASSPRILQYLKPLIHAIQEDFLLLSMCNIPGDYDIPRNCTVIRLTMTKDKLFCNAELEQAFPRLFYFANAIGWMIEILNPKLLVCMDGCQSEYRMAATFCREKNIPSVCLQLGWPSFLHTGFREMPYTHFFAWGDGFNALWSKHNKQTSFISTGYMEEACNCGSHNAISFFLQAPIYLNTEENLKRMCRLIISTAIKYPSIQIFVREHPEYKDKTPYLSDFHNYENISLVNDVSIANVYSQTKVVVSQYSSVLMEGLAYGCIPLVFNPTSGSSYNPDIEIESLGYITKNEKYFFDRISLCLSTEANKNISHWFKAIGKQTVENIINEINSIIL